MIRSNSPVSITETKAVNKHIHDNRPLLLNAVAGFTTTLPAAVGSGARFRFIVGTTLTSASYVIAPTGSVALVGGVLINDTGDSTPTEADFFPASGTTITLAFANGAGVKGDYIELTDIAANTWFVQGFVQAGVDPTTIFS